MFVKKNLEIPPDKINTIIGQGTTFTGNIQGEGSTRIDGGFEGAVSSKGDLFIDQHGYVTAEIKARNIVIAGKYEGEIEADKNLVVKKTGIAHGKFRINGALIIEKGAIITGNLEMELDAVESEETESYTSKPEPDKVMPYKAKESDFDAVVDPETEETVEQPMEDTG